MRGPVVNVMAVGGEREYRLGCGATWEKKRLHVGREEARVFGCVGVGRLGTWEGEACV